jgi:hypothetical protein
MKIELEKVLVKKIYKLLYENLDSEESYERGDTCLLWKGRSNYQVGFAFSSIDYLKKEMAKDIVRTIINVIKKQ